MIIKLYKFGQHHAKNNGLVLADTKFEFGLYQDQLILIDEVLTPDSSRFWDERDYQVGISPKSFDKQIIRDYLETLDWNKKAPGPELPESIVSRASARYHEVLERFLCLNQKSLS